MPTRTHRVVRKLSPFLDRVEPYAIFGAYIAVGIMALFAWVFPPKVTNNATEVSMLIEAALLSIGCVMGLWGHIAKRELIEFYGLISSIGGIVILLSFTIEVVLYGNQWNYGQIIGLILLALALMFSHGFKLYHDITRDWINLTPTEIAQIYKVH